MRSRHKNKKVKRRNRSRNQDDSSKCELVTSSLHKEAIDGSARFSSPPRTSCRGDESWPSALKKRRNISLEAENKSFLQTRARLGEDDDDDTYQIFMRGPSDPFGPIPRAARLEEFCSGVNFETFQRANEAGSLPVTVWRDDRNFESNSPVPNARCQSFTAYGLFRDLSRPRFPSANTTFGNPLGGLNDQARGQMASFVAAGIDKLPTPSLELDADRRLIFITDLDRYSIFALVWTAAPHQVPALRNALFDHLDFNASLSMTASIDSFPAFELAFHLPFFVLKDAGVGQGDHRRDGAGKTLRRSYSVPSINGSATTCSEWLHEAHISCTVTGSDESRWTAYLFADTYYFDPTDEDREDVSEYETDALEDHSMHPDALTYGVEDAKTPIWNPQIYFLAVFARRLSQVRKEWEKVVMKFNERIRAFEDRLEAGMVDPQPLNPLTAALNLPDSLVWVLKTKHLTDRLRHVLSGTIRAYEPFCSQHLACDDGSLRFPRGNRLIVDVLQTYERLCQLEFKLGNLVQSCGHYEKELEARLYLETAQVNATQLQLSAEAMVVGSQQLQLSTDALKLGELQSRLAKESTWFAWMMILYVSPIALTAGIFSMDSVVMLTVLPFVQPTRTWFFGLIVMFGMLGVIVSTAWSYQWSKLTGGSERICAFWTSIRGTLRLRDTAHDLETLPVVNPPASPRP